MAYAASYEIQTGLFTWITQRLTAVPCDEKTTTLPPGMLISFDGVGCRGGHAASLFSVKLSKTLPATRVIRMT
ncbi:hypothetical protein NTD84_21010 [Pseudomonas sp. 14P_8.1_Bac3]|uniref:hypothetical protein n=1 Tax=Pseudomonas sp. 14P_8.1_Bac3 TaxID=2971621 RepID=UPI0021C702FF|nr:hypothetical protein [Pseudomonas sp. 14P_8.1_Bac3]MCU1762187.1 hypothetical protein [Pseudomonas sp. 14P_8.1_Bac3]